MAHRATVVRVSMVRFEAWQSGHSVAASAGNTNGVISVNGQRYDSLDAVSEAALAAKHAPAGMTHADGLADVRTGLESGTSLADIPRRKGASVVDSMVSRNPDWS